MEQVPSIIGFLDKMKANRSLWDTRCSKHFINPQGMEIHYCTLSSEQHTKVIFISNGRCESYLKYEEIICELFQQGFDIVAIDHCGQGLSGRLLDDPQMNHMTDFQYYVDDLKQCYEQTIRSMPQYQERYLLSHSLGGCIALRFIQQNPGWVDKLVLCAPMLGIHLPFFFAPFARPFAKLLFRLESKPHYTITQGPYKMRPFVLNKLTTSKARYQWLRELYNSHPRLKLGGPTNQWILAAYDAMHSCFNEIPSIQLPCLLFQAEKESIVSNSAQDRFCVAMQKNKNQITQHVILGAKHEILFEQDSIRSDVLEKISDFFTI